MRVRPGFQKFLLLGFFLALALALPARGAEITVLESAALPVYNNALQGFTEVIGRDVPSRGEKAIQAHDLTIHVLAESTSQVQLRQQIVNEQPRLLLAIGSSSLALVKGIRDLPILYLMVPFPDAMAQGRPNITGISMNLTAGQQLAALQQAVPEARKVGLLYDPARNESLVAAARDYAAKNGLTLVAEPVRDATEVPARLDDIKWRIDWLWMVPDLTVLNPQSVDYLMLFSLENRVPVFTFADKYLAQGAVLAATIDPYDMGRQAGEMALTILRGAKAADVAPQEARKVVVRSNPKAAQVLGVHLHEREAAQ